MLVSKCKISELVWVDKSILRCIFNVPVCDGWFVDDCLFFKYLCDTLSTIHTNVSM